MGLIRSILRMGSRLITPVGGLVFSDHSVVAAGALATMLAVPGYQTASAASLVLAQTVPFNVPAGSLDTALLQFSVQARMQIISSGAEVGRARTLGVIGVMSIEDALAKLLTGTGLAYRISGERSLVVFASGSLPAAPSTGPPAGEVPNATQVIDETKVKMESGENNVGGETRQVEQQSGLWGRIREFFGAARLGAARTAAVCGAITCAAVPAAHAQIAGQPASAGNELEEVIVTAERRTADIQSTAASVSVRTGAELAAQGRYTTRQILEDVPGLTVVDNSSVNVGSADVQGNNITIRGITPGASAGGGPSGISAAPGAAVYVDGVYEGVGSGYDIERVEVLRGPQGTLYGRSATTGVVAFHTRNPSMDGFAGNAGVELGNYDLQHYTAAVNIPLARGLAVRVSGDYRDQGEGYDGQASRGMGKRTDGRAKLLWEPNDDFSLLVGFAYQKSDDFSGGNSTTAAPPTLALTTRTGAIFPGHKQKRQYWAEANWDVGPVKVTYLPAYRTWEQNDYLFQAADFIGVGHPLHQIFLTPTDSFHTQELRVASRDDSAVQWQAGAFYYRNKLSNTNHVFLATSSNTELAVISDTNDQKDTKNLGFFAEATLPLGASMRMTLGARYDDTRVVVSEFNFNNPYFFCGTNIEPVLAPVLLPPGAVCTGPAQASVPPLPGIFIPDIEVNFHNFNYKARIEYDLTQKNMMYGMISTGFRPGDAGINSTTRVPNILDAEKLTSIEVGSKNRFLDDSLQLNVGLYYYSYHGFQTSYQPDTANTADYALQNNTIRLTVPARNLGGELELMYRLTANDRVGLNYNYVRSRWHDAPAAFVQAQPEKKRAMTPYTITANYEHVFSLSGGSTLSARIDGRFEAAHLTQNLHVDWLRLGYDQYVHIGSRTIGNLSAAWASNGGRYSISAYVRNFTDKQYTSYTVLGDPTSLNVNFSDPRTYGAQLSARF